jgi:hypothetical protein
MNVSVLGTGMVSRPAERIRDLGGIVAARGANIAVVA